MQKSDSISELAQALCKAQEQMSGAKKGSANPFFKSKYADLTAVMQAASEPLQNNGLSFCQFPISEDSKCGVETILMHNSGEWMSGRLLLACSKQDPQAYGSAITYAKRYSLQAMLGIPSEDDDGNLATQGPIASASQHTRSVLSKKSKRSSNYSEQFEDAGTPKGKSTDGIADDEHDIREWAQSETDISKLAAKFNEISDDRPKLASFIMANIQALKNGAILSSKPVY